MNRSHSAQTLSQEKNGPRPRPGPSKSLPNIELLSQRCPEPKPTVRRVNSRRVKLLQKTWDKVKTIIHPSSGKGRQGKGEVSPGGKAGPGPSSSTPSTPSSKGKLVFDFENVEAEDERVVRNYVELQKRLSEELHQSMAGPSGGHGQEVRKDRLSDDFKKRLVQWDMWKASTGKSVYTEEELRAILPTEFSKKLQEWEERKAGVRTPDPPPIKSPRHHKELAWLERQLEKIEVEKRRLEREMRKYCEREARLEKMREALKNSPGPREEVWIRTPTAECRVGGINEKFTKRLFEWEEKQGIQPESSTMALLSPKYFATEQEVMEPAVLDLNPPLSDHEEDPEEDLSPKGRSYTSSEEDSEYEATTDSFAPTQDPASGASNTDSECFNLKAGPGRRRSSDAISTPLSARSPSPGCCTSEDDMDGWMLTTVNENEEEKHGAAENTQPVIKAKPIVIDDETPGPSQANNIIVQTKRTIFKPVRSPEALQQSSTDHEPIARDHSPPVPIETVHAHVSTSKNILISSKHAHEPIVRDVPITAALAHSPTVNDDSILLTHAPVSTIWDVPITTAHVPLAAGRDVPKPKTHGPMSSVRDVPITTTHAPMSTVRDVPITTTSGVNAAHFTKTSAPMSIVRDVPLILPPAAFLRYVHLKPGPAHAPSLPKTSLSEPVWRKIEPPRIVGAIRKTSNASSIILNPISSPAARAPKGSGKIPVWCSPLLARRKMSQKEATEQNQKLAQINDFSLDKFLMDTNLIPAQAKVSRIPVNASPGPSRKKYSMTGGPVPPDEAEPKVRLISLTRSTSFQGGGRPAGLSPTIQEVWLQEEPPAVPQPLNVVKSKSTGSMLGESSAKGLFGLRTRFGLKPAWLKSSASGKN